MRWLLLKDLQILRRSPLLVGLLVVYPIIIALLMGFALSRAPDRPKVAFLNQVPPSQNNIAVNGENIDTSKYASQLFQSVDPIRVHTRKQALDKVRSGEALAALIIPPDITQKLSTGLQSAQVEVVYNNSDEVKGNFVDSLINSRLSDANQALSEKFKQVAVSDIDLLLKGGSFDLLGRTLNILGLQKTKVLLQAILQTLPKSSTTRPALEQITRFAGLAVDNLNLANDVLATVSKPIDVKRTPIGGRRTPLSAFAIAISVTVSLMFVTMLLAAGMLAMEREEHAFARLVRGLVSRSALLAEKIGLAAICAFAVALVMLVGIGAFVGLEWSRWARWLVALAFGSLGFAALGVAIGALTREVRAASLLAFLLSLPIAFLALVPSGAVSKDLFDLIRVVSAIFPFKASLQALDAALNSGREGFGAALAHLAALTVGFGVIARLALRRFA